MERTKNWTTFKTKRGKMEWLQDSTLSNKFFVINEMNWFWKRHSKVQTIYIQRSFEPMKQMLVLDHFCCLSFEPMFEMLQRWSILQFDESFRIHLSLRIFIGQNMYVYLISLYSSICWFLSLFVLLLILLSVNCIYLCWNIFFSSILLFISSFLITIVEEWLEWTHATDIFQSVLSIFTREIWFIFL